MDAATTNRSRARPATPRPPSLGRLVSPQIRQLVGRRLSELAGVILAVAGVALIVAVLSYHAQDPSLDTASARPVANLAGAPGAMVADLLVQGVGVIAILPGLMLVAWAWRIAAHRGVARGGARLLALAIAMPMLAGALAVVPLPAAAPAWPSIAGLGGAVGHGVAAPLLRLLGGLVGPATQHGTVLAACALIGGVAAWIAFGLSLREWSAAARGLGTGVHLSAIAARHAAEATNRHVAGIGRRFADPIAAQFDDPDPRGELPPPRLDADAADPDHGPADPQRLTRIPPAPPVTPTVRPAAAAGLVATRDAPPRPEPVAPPLTLRSRVIAARTAKTLPPQQESLALPEPGWVFPSLSLLKTPPPRPTVGPDEDALQGNARLLETVLGDYGVQGTIRDIHPGPVVTLYELEPAPGIRSARVIGLADDIARSLSVTAVRIATVSGRNVIGIEVPNARRETVYLAELIGSDEWARQGGRLGLALGKDIGGAPQIADLARMPHLLIAGTTGSGKSVGINAMILSLLYKLSPDQCRLIMIDPKMLELSVYEGIPHLMAPVVTEPAKAVSALKWTVREMERRYRAMTGLNVRNLAGYNERVADAQARGEVVTRRVQTGFDPETNRPTFEDQPLSLETLPLIVVVIDEMADLMMVAGKEIEAAVQRLAQMARAAGIHVIMATQRPSVDVITGTIKANFPTRISFQVISKFDSRTILGEQGAEQLLGQGDMLYMAGGGRITRVHGPFVTDREVEDVVAFLRTQGEPAYLDEVTEGFDEDDAKTGGGGGGNHVLSGIAGASLGEQNLFDQAVALVSREGRASTSFVQRHLAIGYNKAAKLIEQMEKEGVVTAANHVGKREVLTRRTRDDDD